MDRTADEQFLHDWVIRKLKDKYSRIYKEVHINPGDEQNYGVKGHYPDAVCVNYGQIVLIIEVETKDTVNETELGQWKEMSQLGVQLVVLVPKELQGVARDICWKHAIVSKVKIGSFDVVLNV